MALFTRISQKPVRLAVGPLAIAALGLSACGGGASLDEKTLNFKLRDTDYFSYLDAAPKTKLTADGPKEVSNGDRLTISDDLVDGSSKDVGNADTTCTITRTSGEPRRGVAAGPMDSAGAVCSAVITIPGGSLTASFGNPFAKGGQGGGSMRGSIDGGTGDYAGATGEFISEGESGVAIHIFVPNP